MLKLERQARGLSQDELAGVAGVSAATIKNLEQGRGSAPRGDTAMRLLGALHRTAPLARAVAESLLHAARLAPGLAAQLEAAAPPGLSPTAQLAHRAVDALIHHLGEERALGVLQSFMLAAGVPQQAAHSLRPPIPPPPGALAIDHPEGVRQYVPTATPTTEPRRAVHPRGYAEAPPAASPGPAAPHAAAAPRPRAK